MVDDEPGFRVRPYALTGGRTRSNLDLPLETLVLISDRGNAVFATSTATGPFFTHSAIRSTSDS